MGPAHFAIGLAAKPLAPKAPLWALLAAGEALDLLFFGFAAAGMESAGVSQMSMTEGLKVSVAGYAAWSHGLFMAGVWSLAAAALAYLIWRDRRASGVIGLVVFSHWILDFIVHPAELPLLFNSSPLMGLGLWTSGPGLIASFILEVGLLVGGIVLYRIGRKRIIPSVRNH